MKSLASILLFAVGQHVKVWILLFQVKIIITKTRAISKVVWKLPQFPIYLIMVILILTWVGEYMDVKAVLRIASSNKNKIVILKQLLCMGNYCTGLVTAARDKSKQI